MFICFGSGDYYEPTCTPHFVSSDIFDVEGKLLTWRYINNNAKGSITEEYYGLYIKDVIYPAMGRPKPKTLILANKGL